MLYKQTYNNCCPVHALNFNVHAQFYQTLTLKLNMNYDKKLSNVTTMRKGGKHKGLPPEEKM